MFCSISNRYEKRRNKNDLQIRGLRAGISFAEKKIIINQRKMRIYT